MSEVPFPPFLLSALREFSCYPLLAGALQARELSAKVHILAIGKAAWQMAAVALQNLPSGHTPDGYVLTKYGFSQAALPPLQVREAGHPVPDSNSFLHTREILNWLGSLPTGEDLIILLSGGGSALFEAVESSDNPDSGELQSREQQLANLHRLLLCSGLDIARMNSRRSEISAVKAGKALRYLQTRRVHIFALSDVEGNDPRVIASGPFTGSDTDNYTLIGDNQAFLRCLKTALCASAPVKLARKFLHEPVGNAAKRLSRYIQSAPAGIYLLGGETPLKVRGEGKGGRCSHLALHFATLIQGSRDIKLLCFASDGNDNLPECSGARVDGDTCRKLRQAGIDPDQALRTCDSYTALAAIGAVLPGVCTGTNVNDVFVLQKSRGHTEG
jgi:hydroxypyruvate reductase